MALHKLPKPEAEHHDPNPRCRCGPELARVNWRGVQREAWYHRPLDEPADECDTRPDG